MTETENTSPSARHRDLAAQIEAARVLPVQSRGTRGGEHQTYTVLVLSDETTPAGREIRLIANAQFINVSVRPVGGNGTRNLIDVTGEDGRRLATGMEVIGASGILATTFDRNGGEVVDFTTPDAHIVLAVQYGLSSLGYL